VLRYNQICRLPKANPSNLKFFRNWLDHDEGGHLFLQGREAWTWDPSHTEDIISVSGMSTNKDMLSQWISDRFIPWYHCNVGCRMKVSHCLRRKGSLQEGIGSTLMTVSRSLRATQRAIVFGSTPPPLFRALSARSALSLHRSYLSFRYLSSLPLEILWQDSMPSWPSRAFSRWH
jgi:hypothetical protein